MSPRQTKGILGVDIDNVVSATDAALRRLFWDLWGVWLDEEDVTCYEYGRCGISRDQEQVALEIFRDVTCSQLDVVPGAVEALALLSKTYEIVLVTSRNPVILEKTQEWLTRHAIPHDSLVFEKAKHQTGRDFDFFVEDHGEFALSLADSGVHTFLFDYPWNRYVGPHPRITRVADWQDVLARLM